MDITKPSDLNSIGEDSEVNLCEDIEIPVDMEINTCTNFNGVFHGNNYKISNLNNPLFETIQMNGVVKNFVLEEPVYKGDLQDLNLQVFGLVACENKGKIKNVSVQDAYIDCKNSMKTGLLVGITTNLHNEGFIKTCRGTGYVESDGVVGGLIGRSYYGKLEELQFKGSVKGDVAGGVVGELNNSDILRIKCEGNVEGTTTGGGLIASSDHSEIHQCGSMSNVRSLVRAGGFSGELYKSKVTRSYSTGTVSAKDQMGGFSTQMEKNTLENIYWDYPSSKLSDEYKTENCVSQSPMEIEAILSIL